MLNVQNHVYLVQKVVSKDQQTLILENYFDAVDLRVAKNNDNKLLGFIGVAESNIEVLFISPNSRNKGVAHFC